MQLFRPEEGEEATTITVTFEQCAETGFKEHVVAANALSLAPGDTLKGAPVAKHIDLSYLAMRIMWVGSKLVYPPVDACSEPPSGEIPLLPDEVTLLGHALSQFDMTTDDEICRITGFIGYERTRISARRVEGLLATRMLGVLIENQLFDLEPAQEPSPAKLVGFQRG